MQTTDHTVIAGSLQLPRKVHLNHQLTLCLGPIGPGDKERIREGIKKLSPETSYHRFFTPAFRASEQELAYLTDIDGESHMAIGARDLTREGEPGIGVARYVRLSDTPRVAEAAVLVVDAYQDRGIGSLLMAVLGAYAAERGIETFRAYVLRDNNMFLQFLTALGAKVAGSEQGAVVVNVPVFTNRDQIPDRPEAQPLLKALDLLYGQPYEPC